ncbi:MAG: CPBP family glutamic-type intramembrane protease [Bacteroidota bacterium]
MFRFAIQELRNFFKKPQEWIAYPTSQLASFQLLIASYLLFLIPVFGSIGILGLAEQMGVYEAENHGVAQMLEQFSPIVVLGITVIVAPIIEETIFRLPLRWSRAYLFRVLLFPIYITGPNTFQGAKQGIQNWWNRNYVYIFYAIAIAFGVVHATNFPEMNSWATAIWIPFLVLPQILIGLLLGFIRLRLGFWWAVLTHALHNFIFIGIALLVL